MAEHKWLPPERSETPLRETRSNYRGAVPHTTPLCDGPHVLFNNALLYSGHRFPAPVSFQA
jgi:hypothetical protein